LQQLVGWTETAGYSSSSNSNKQTEYGINHTKALAWQPRTTKSPRILFGGAPRWRVLK